MYNEIKIRILCLEVWSLLTIIFNWKIIHGQAFGDIELTCVSFELRLWKVWDPVALARRRQGGKSGQRRAPYHLKKWSPVKGIESVTENIPP